MFLRGTIARANGEGPGETSAGFFPALLCGGTISLRPHSTGWTSWFLRFLVIELIAIALNFNIYPKLGEKTRQNPKAGLLFRFGKLRKLQARALQSCLLQ